MLMIRLVMHFNKYLEIRQQTLLIHVLLVHEVYEIGVSGNRISRSCFCYFVTTTVKSLLRYIKMPDTLLNIVM